MFTKTTQRNVFFPVQIHIPGPLPPKQQVPENFRTHQACKSRDSVGCCSLSGSLQSPLAPRKAHEAYEKSLFLTPRRRHSPGFQPAPHHKEMQSQQLWVSMTGTPKDIWRQKRKLWHTLQIQYCAPDLMTRRPGPHFGLNRNQTEG